MNMKTARNVYKKTLAAPISEGEGFRYWVRKMCRNSSLYDLKASTTGKLAHIVRR